MDLEYTHFSLQVPATAISLHETANRVEMGQVYVLVWLGYTFLNHAKKASSEIESKEVMGIMTSKDSFLGFSIALLNPKILAWMLALYTPFIENNVSNERLLGMGFLGMMIDGTWYVTVALALTTGGRVEKLKSISHIIDGAMGILMFICWFNDWRGDLEITNPRIKRSRTYEAK